MIRLALLCAMMRGGLSAQEAAAGFELAATVSGAAYYSHALVDGPANGGFRTMLYPTLKLSERWSASAAVQFHSSPYFREQFGTPEHNVRANVLQAQMAYSRFWKNRSMVVRLGQLSSAFGAFLLRYDDAANPLIDMPLAYGYYYKSVSTLGLPGIQMDASLGKLDVRGQFTNSSPSNRRTLLDSDQYGSYTAGAGYTIVQGFRVGASVNRGAYLHRQHRFFFPGEARPKDLPSTAFAIDVQYGRGPWNLFAEWQHNKREYKAIPNFVQKTGYAEVRRVLHPRWYVAGRFDYERASAYPGREVVDMVIGFRPNRHQLLKVGYAVAHGPAIRGSLGNVVSVQLVTTLRPLSIALD